MTAPRGDGGWSPAPGAEARRVLLVHSSAGHYGADRQLGLLARTLDPERWRPVVLLPFDGPLAAELRDAGVLVLTSPVAVLRREALSPRGGVRLAASLGRQRRHIREIVARHGVDVVHANTSVLLGLRGASPRLVAHVREIYPRTPVLWPAHRRGLLRADRVLCVSEAVRAALDTRSAHVRVIHDGLAVEPHRADRSASRRELGLPSDAFVVAVLGRVSSWKGQEVMVRALRPGMVGLVAGDAWPGQEHHEQRLRELVERTGADARLIGFREDVATVYGAADVVVVPSTAPDPLPNSALEAAAAGCCVVAAAHGGLPEIIEDARTGRLVPPGDPAALGAVLAELREDPGTLARLGAAAADDVRVRFAPAALAGRVMAVYDELV